MSEKKLATRLTDFLREIYSCVHCGYCLEACPARDASYFDVYGSRGKMQLFKSLLEGKTGISKDFADRIFNCALCGWCTYKCPEELPTTDIFVAARHECVSKGIRFMTIEAARKYLLKNQNPFGASDSERIEWSKGLNLKRSGEIALFASCMNPLMGYTELINVLGIPFEKLVELFKSLEEMELDRFVREIAGIVNPNEYYQEVLRRAVKILRFIGIEPAYLHEDEPCCGKPLHTYGYLEDFVKQAEYTAKMLKERGIKTLILLNPVCLYVFRVLYPKFLGNFDIDSKHISEILAENLDKWSNRAAFRNPVKVTYHDPCYLTRYLDVIEAPRIVINSIRGVELVEPEYTKKETYCDGGGGVEVTHPEAAVKMAARRARMLLETGARKIVTACPACVAMIRVGLRAINAPEDIEVIDLVDLVYEALIQNMEL